MQLDYNEAPAIGRAGGLVDSSPGRIVSAKALETIGFGLAVVKQKGVDDQCRLPVANRNVWTEDAGTYTAGSIVATVNGFTVTQAYDTNKATTLAALAAKIQALAFVSTSAYAANAITTVAEDNVNLEISYDISGITGTMTQSSSVYSCTDALFGVALCNGLATPFAALPSLSNDQAVITISGDALNTSDTVTVTINGVALSAITYATSEAVTLNLVAQAIANVAGVASASVSGRVITVLNNPGYPLVINRVAIHDNALAAVAPSATTVHSQQNAISVGTVAYLATDAVPVLRQGQIYVTVEEAVTSDDSVYVRFIASGGNGRGGFRKSADSYTAALWSGARYASSAAAGEVAAIEINLP